MVIGSFFDTSPLGRELTLDLAKHIVVGYTLQEPPLIRLLQNAVFHFMPFTENFDSILTQFDANAQLCDPTAREEFADRLLSPESSAKKSIFLKLLESERFDLALTFSAGGYDIQGPSIDNPNSIFAKAIAKIGETRLRESTEECALNQLRIHQTNTQQKIIDFLLNQYKLPLYSLQVGCCKMPPKDQIATVWRQNIHKVLNFLKLLETGVKGVIKNSQSVPLRHSTVTVVNNELTIPVTKNLASFRFALPAGQYELQINSTDTGIQTMPINLVDGQIIELNNILLQQKQSANYQVGNGQSIGTAEVKAVFGGKIAGYILDARNHPLKNAQISLINAKQKLTNTSDYLGAFLLSGTPFGAVTLRVDAYGHESATRY